MEVWDLATWRDFIKRRYPRFYETEAQLREKAGRGDAMKIEDARKLIKEARDWYTACDDRCMPGCCCGCDVTALADLAEKALAELAYIDSILARRPALDLPTRAENIEKAINAAKQADVALADVERLEKVCEVLTGEVNGNALLAEKALAEVERLKGLLAALHPASGTTINLDELLTGWKKQAEADLAALRERHDKLRAAVSAHRQLCTSAKDWLLEAVLLAAEPKPESD